MKRTSVGLLITDGTRFLVCHSTGNRFYDLPKGLLEEGEAPLDACRREVMEETGIDVKSAELLDLGVLPYMRDKDLHLFVWKTAELPDTEQMVCTSYFLHRYTYKPMPEVDGYLYISFPEKGSYLTKSMNQTISKIEYSLY